MANLLRKGNRTELTASSTTRRGAPAITDVSSSQQSEYTGCNPWDVAQIWIECVSKEESTRKQWEQMYGWMADYDPKGNLKPKKCTIGNSTRFSNKVPNSRGHDYGWRLQSDVGQEIKNLQTRFNSQHKHHVPKDVLGYD